MDAHYVKICPKCRSDNIESDMSALNIARGSFNNEYRCKDCGYSGMFFPEIEGRKRSR